MKDINNGGPAFPGPDQRTQREDIHEGMTLRDAFAIAALPAMLASNENRGFTYNAGESYELADAMIVAREPAEPPDIRVSNDCLDLMERQGGSFIKSLAHCYMMADPENKARLRVSMHDWFESYTNRVAARGAA